MVLTWSSVGSSSASASVPARDEWLDAVCLARLRGPAISVLATRLGAAMIDLTPAPGWLHSDDADGEDRSEEQDDFADG